MLLLPWHKRRQPGHIGSSEALQEPSFSHFGLSKPQYPMLVTFQALLGFKHHLHAHGAFLFHPHLPGKWAFCWEEVIAGWIGN